MHNFFLHWTLLIEKPHWLITVYDLDPWSITRAKTYFIRHARYSYKKLKNCTLIDKTFLWEFCLFFLFPLAFGQYLTLLSFPWLIIAAWLLCSIGEQCILALTLLITEKQTVNNGLITSCLFRIWQQKNI